MSFYASEQSKELNNLKDVNITTPVDGQAPVYNGTTQKWENKEIVQKNQISNPNLLDNPWFTVNQRRSTVVQNTYGCDRWAGIYTWNNNIVSLSANDYIIQFFEDNFKAALNGKMITVSIMLANGNVISGSNTYSSSSDVTYIDTEMLSCSSFNAVNYALAITAKTAIDIKAIKLELGSISTLAMDTSPNYQQELAKCQRYFIRVTGNVVALNDQGTYDDSFFHEMRANAAFSNGSVSVWNNGWTPITPTEFNVENSSGKNFVRQLIILGTSYAYIDVLVSYDLSADL